MYNPDPTLRSTAIFCRKGRQGPGFSRSLRFDFHAPRCRMRDIALRTEPQWTIITFAAACGRIRGGDANWRTVLSTKRGGTAVELAVARTDRQSVLESC